MKDAVAPPSRTYHSPLRARQSAQTRELILAALADAITEHGLEDVIVADVAARAGVAERTVYRHFPRHQDLIDGLTDRVDQMMTDRLGRTFDPAKPEDMVAEVVNVYESFDALGTPARAMALAALSSGARSRAHDERTGMFRHIFRPALDHLDPDTADAVFAIIRHLCGSQAWYLFRDEFGIDGARAGRAVAWAVTAMLAELRAGHGPDPVVG